MIALRNPIWHCAGEHEIPPGEAWLAPGERDRLSGLRFTKRRNDYLLGRYVGKSAVARALGLGAGAAALRRVEIRNRRDGAERGAPEVFLDGAPAPVEISITDRAGWGVVMLSPIGTRSGCDLELVEPRSGAFVSTFLTAREQEFVEASRSEGGRSARANLLWSAKESVLKSLRTGLRRDTRSIEIEVSGDEGPEGWSWFSARLDEGGGFTGWWRRFGPFVLTIAFETASAPPRGLIHPAGLEQAVPSHRWMESPRADAPGASP